MKLFVAYYLLIFLSLRVASQEVASEEPSYYAKQGCNDMCGKVRIPYPFGIGANCAINEWYVVDCNNSTKKPYLSVFYYRFEIKEVILENQTITVFTPTPKIPDCQNPVTSIMMTQNNPIDLGGSPFLLSPPDNIFVFEGCGNATMMMMDDGSTVVTSCSTKTCSVDQNMNNCSLGNNCCQTTIPPTYLHSINVSLTIDKEKQGSERACRSAFVMDTSLYNNPGYYERMRNEGFSYVPISLLWTLSEDDYKNVTNCSCGLGKVKLRVPVMGNGTTSVDSWKCRSYSSYEGSSYLQDGCHETTVTQYKNDACLKNCGDNNGSYCDDTYTIYNVDGSVYEDLHQCRYKHKTPKSLLSVVLGVSISMGLLFLMAISYALYKLIKKTKDKRQRKRFFKRNGGILLKQQAEADPSLVDKTIIFTSRELAKATDNFSENRVIGRGGQGTVYKGMLMDGRIVAIKKSMVVDESQLEQFINEVVILSQVNHRNVVKLLGCCLETDVPMLVSEFISSGTLYDLLHNGTDEFPFSLNMRLQIATEVAGAVAYLHSATSIPIYHRDIKTTNILLDDKYRAKVSDFGTSRLISVDKTHLTTMVKGTFGYLDPEYFQSSQLTEKSDVYSFGVVLVELITGEKPISLTRFGEHRSLATYFTIAMEEGRVTSIFDEKMIKEASRDELLLVAKLAMQCLNVNGKNRPTMKEVAIELETIRSIHIPSMVQNNIIPMIHAEELSVHPYGESTSTFMTHEEELSEQPYGESTSTFTSIDDSICHIGSSM